MPLSPLVKTKDVHRVWKAGTKAFCAADDGVVRSEPAVTITAPTTYANCLSLTPMNN
jgi:hypothetical protein